MKFYNINDPTERVGLRQAVLRSLSSSSGLYMPEYIPVLPASFLSGMRSLSFREIAFNVSKAMLHDDIPPNALEMIVDEAFTFPVPLRRIEDDLYVLELFHGPTFAFKDFGARFMAGLFTWLVKDERKEVTILTATSGDTGSAVANAFYGKEGIKVIILYPSGKVSELQEKQLTTMGGNIKAVEVAGDFDDCQRLVKSAFMDPELNKRLNLTSANSINFARLFPQSFYYFSAVSQLPESKLAVVISVPSGNFGNLTAGLLAKKMGLPVDKFIASNNSNHAVVDFLHTGKYQANKTIQTISNAMDVGNPNNFPRILEMYEKHFDEITRDISGYWYSDYETREGMKELFKTYKYLSDPHGAVAYLGLRDYRHSRKCSGVFVETAHPAKFLDEVEKTTGTRVEVPVELDKLRYLEKQTIKLKAEYSDFRELLTRNIF
jgi:threonine synthase